MTRSSFQMTGDDPEAQQQGPVLADCSRCGEDAAWYRPDPPTAAAAVTAAVPKQDGGRGEKACCSSIPLENLPSSLCEECFRDAVPQSQHDRWQRIEMAEDVRSASEAQQEQQWANQATAVGNWAANNQNAGSSSGWGWG